MECNYIHVRLKDKSNINLNKHKILELFKLSIGNNVINLNYNKNKEESPNQNIQIIYSKKNIGKMIYSNLKTNKAIKIIDGIFISNNIKRANIIINNKIYELKENIVIYQKQYYKIKIKFLIILLI